MKRTKKRQTKVKVEDIADTLIIIPKAVFDILLKENNSGDLIALYSFYYYTAKWQKTNQIKATNSYCQKGLNIGETRLLKAKTILINLGLIKNIKIYKGGWYIKIMYIIKSKILKEEPEKQDSYKNPKKQGLGKQGINALSSNNKNALSSNNKKTKTKKPLIEYFPNKWKKNISFQELINDYITHRKEKKSNMTTIACERLAKKLTKWTIQKASEAIENTLENGYTGVFEPLNTKSKSSNSNGSHNTSLKKQKFTHSHKTV